MSALRPNLYPRFGSYVCPSCIVRLQGQRRFTWRAQNSASSATPAKDDKRVPQKRDKLVQRVLDPAVVVKHFYAKTDGTLEPAEDDLGEDTLSELKSRIAALEADLRELKDKRPIPKDGELLDQLLSS